MKYIKANKVTPKHEIDPNEDGTWYRVISNSPVKVPGVGPHRDIYVEADVCYTSFSFASGDEVRARVVSAEVSA